MPEDALVTMARKITDLEREVRRLQTIQVGYTTGDIIGMVQQFPALRCFWPMSSVNENGVVFDISGQGRTLANNGTVTFGVENSVMPYASLNGSSQYLSRADEAALDITGAVTFGGWFYASAWPASRSPLIGKWNTTGNQRSYLISFDNTGLLSTAIDRLGDATSLSSVNHTSSFSTGAWHFVVSRYTPSTELALWLNGTKVTNTTSIVASCYSSSSALMLGSSYGATLFLAGRVSMSFICAYALPDARISKLYDISRGFFGV